MIKDVNEYFIKGCGRCKYFDTSKCKVKPWSEQLKILREIALSCELTEEAKWGVPVYTLSGKNIIIVSAFKEYVSISFFKGVLLKDTHNILIAATKNSQADRSLRFTETLKIVEIKSIIKEYILEAIEIEKSGAKIEYKPVSSLEIPIEFQEQLDSDPVFKDAFNSLTPGRQKGYLLHFSGAKQSKTRSARIEKCIPKIMDGIGLNDR
jgi:uncharacterized protein YdeI (YjbR/CyaY-like superfamily)